MTYLSALLGALLAVIIIGAVAHFAISRLTWDLPVRSSAFCLTLGFAIARFSGEFGVDEALVPLLRAVGAALGLMILWYWWFRRPARAGASNG